MLGMVAGKISTQYCSHCNTDISESPSMSFKQVIVRLIVAAVVVCRVKFFILVMALFVFAQAVRVMVDYWLGMWVNRRYHLSTRIYVISYACFSAGAIMLSLSRALLFTEFAMLSAKQMHGRMAERVLRSPQLFFDQVFAVPPSVIWALLLLILCMAIIP